MGERDIPRLLLVSFADLATDTTPPGGRGPGRQVDMGGVIGP
jgi:hypothetical protein